MSYCTRKTEIGYVIYEIKQGCHLEANPDQSEPNLDFRQASSGIFQARGMPGLKNPNLNYIWIRLFWHLIGNQFVAHPPTTETKIILFLNNYRLDIEFLLNVDFLLLTCTIMMNNMKMKKERKIDTRIYVVR